ncbi:hypothetical protein B0H21DRAFT_710527 [Amylocystis lapponica]|nr:hypothetical protein B0H21DRAFT_710527 [Amylocystis lapponica]
MALQYFFTPEQLWRGGPLEAARSIVGWRLAKYCDLDSPENGRNRQSSILQAAANHMRAEAPLPPAPLMPDGYGLYGSNSWLGTNRDRGTRRIQHIIAGSMAGPQAWALGQRSVREISEKTMLRKLECRRQPEREKEGLQGGWVPTESELRWDDVPIKTHPSDENSKLRYIVGSIIKNVLLAISGVHGAELPLHHNYSLDINN